MYEATHLLLLRTLSRQVVAGDRENENEFVKTMRGKFQNWYV